MPKKLDNKENLIDLSYTVHKKLTIGQSIKNFKELCDLLDYPIPEKGNSNSRKARQELFERCFSYHTEGQKIIVDDIYVEPLPELDVKGIGVIFQRVFMMWVLDTGRADTQFMISDIELIEELKVVNEKYFALRNIFKMNRKLLKATDSNYINNVIFYYNCDKYFISELSARMIKSMEKRMLLASANKCYVVDEQELTPQEELLWNNILNIVSRQSYNGLNPVLCMNHEVFGEKYREEITNNWLWEQNKYTKIPKRVWKINVSKLCAEMALIDKEKDNLEKEINIKIVESLKKHKHLNSYHQRIDDEIKKG